MLTTARYSQVLGALRSVHYWVQLALLLAYWNARTLFSRIVLFLITYGSTLSLYGVVVSFVLLVEIPIGFVSRSRLAEVVTVNMQHPFLCALFCGELVLLTGGAVSEWVGSMSGRTALVVVMNMISSSVEYYGVASRLERVTLLLGSAASCTCALLMWAYYATLLPDASLGKAYLYLQYTFLVQSVAHTLEAAHLVLTTALKVGLFSLLSYCLSRIAPRVQLENSFIDPSSNLYRLVFGAAHSLLTFFFAWYYCPSDMPFVYQLSVFRKLLSTVISYCEFRKYFKLLEAFPSVPGDPSERCAICLETFSAHERVRRMPCEHLFHDGCLRAWLLRASSCPVCRHPVHSFLPTGNGAAAPQRTSRSRQSRQHFIGFVQPMPRPRQRPQGAAATPPVAAAQVLLELRRDPRITLAAEKLERAAVARRSKERAYSESRSRAEDMPGSPLPWREGARMEELVGAQDAESVRDQLPKRQRDVGADSGKGEEEKGCLRTASADGRPPKRKRNC